MQKPILLLPFLLLVSCSPPNPSEAPSAVSPSVPSKITIARSQSGLAYEWRGDGPVVVLIHGTNLDRRMWDAEAEWLGEETRVLRYDLRGQGASDFPVAAYSNHADLLALLDELEIAEATLVGLSAGVQVALDAVLDAALAAPGRIQRLVLVSPSMMGYVPEETPPFFAELGAALREGDFARANEVLLASPVMAVPEEFAPKVETLVKENERLWTIPYSLVELATPPALERLEEVQVPTLVLVGENDLAAVRAQGRLLEERLPTAELVVVPGGGHLLNMTSPTAFREAVSGFLGFE